MLPIHFLAAVGVMAIWGSNFVVLKLCLQEISPFTLAAVRFFLTAFPAVFFIRRPAASFTVIATFGLVMFSLQFSLLFSGMKAGVSAGLASLILQLQVFFTLGLAVLFMGERLSRGKTLGALLAFAGIALIAFHRGGSVTISGLVLIIAAAAAWGTGNLISKKAGAVNMVAMVVWGSLFAWIPLLGLALAMEGVAGFAGSLAKLSGTGICAIAYNVYPVTLLGFSVWNSLLRKYPAVTIAPLSLLVPVFGMLCSVVVLGEALEPWKIASTGLVLAGLAVALLESRMLSKTAASRSLTPRPAPEPSRSN
jgi:O-acetylserine/cysteine efflux transporter